ncbi:chloroplast sensor kinase, chloroplastic [Cynara cardunculus var. scolymus]|uniref:chloroplast sensor kinase, chloroplastic n=1 Tax=Cynara cardunculus var. scolymus TaxID=59895 RepID=UPI000D623464|nr:chloroplast sensor kinase, chloroplastic [Cynara cardunculus var. scolymus]
MILSSVAPQFHHHRHHDVRGQVVYRSATTITAVHCCNPNSAAALRQVNSSNNNNSNTREDDVVTISSASAVAAAIRKASTSPVEFVQRIEQDGKNKGLVLPSSDFQTLCVEQLDLFRRIVDPDALLSVYVRPAGSYVMDRLELRRVTIYPGRNVADIVIVIGNFSIATGLRAAEASLLKQEAEFIPESRALVFPMVKHPFVVGFLVAEIPKLEIAKEENDVKQGSSSEESYAVYPYAIPKSWEIQSFVDKTLEMHNFSAEQRLNAINISRSVAIAYVMDQKAMLLQQSSWQNNIRMSNLVEQIRGPLASIRTLSKMLSVNMKKTETSYDIVEDIMVLGDRMKETLQQLQDAVHMTKANIVRYNEENLMKIDESTHESVRSQLSNVFTKDTSIAKAREYGGPFSLSSKSNDLEMPMPPLVLAPSSNQNIRPCNASDIVSDLVGALEPLAHKQQRVIQICELPRSLEVAVEEPALRQALSNLIEGALLRTNVGGMIEIMCTASQAGDALILIDDDGPDMHYMTQMHSLTPFGTDLLSKGMVEDNMTWNFIAGLTVAREILETYGCVLRVISPRFIEAALGAGGTRIEIWLPSSSSSPKDGPAQVP